MPTVRSFIFRSEDLKGIGNQINFLFSRKNKKVPTTEEMETSVNSGSDIETDGKDFIKSEPNSNTIESDVNDESFNGK